MATKTNTKRRTKSQAKAIEFNWEDFRPEWANERIDRISAELEKWNDDLQSRSAKFRKESQKRIEKSVTQIQKELRKLPAVKRAEKLRSEFEKRVEQRVEQGVDRVYTSLKLARLDEVQELEKKVAQLNRKLRTLEKKFAA